MDSPDIERQRASIPEIVCPADLPISEHADALTEAIAANQVLIVAGETGSGKSTQLPKLCLRAGLGERGWIGHTQPRRLAARTVAERVAEELGEPDLVGYTIRFDDQAGPSTLIKTMTDGILLAEFRRDPQLSRYEAIIVDEAHERSLNIDFLLGCVRELIEVRDDLRLIIASATIDTARFAEYFDNAPVVEVSGRGHPVEIRYRPLGAGSGEGRVAASAGARAAGGAEWIEGIEAAVRELLAEGLGDVLVFCSGEREIRDAVEHLAGALDDVEVLALYARLSPAEQQRVFAAHDNRRVVVATNVAETSLTVPGIRSVVDAGTARISRFNRRTKVQRLPIEPISQASAQQRAGRCGRLGPGVCIRLYSEDDCLARPEFAEPEIRRTDLAAVILSMAAQGLGEPSDFRFIDPPSPAAVRDGISVLTELGALNPDPQDPRGRITPLGARLAELPVDVRLARMVLAADEHGCVSEMLVIASGLAIQDPRIRPTTAEGAAARKSAEAMHARFETDGSGFLAYLRLWRHIVLRRSELSGNAFRRMCREELLHYLRIREWQDLHAQLSRSAQRLGLTISDSEASPDSVHRAVLSGLLSRIGVFDPRRGDYRGPRGLRFAIAARAGDDAGRRHPEWVMAAEIIETERVLARVCAPIDPCWVESAAAHLLRWEYSTPWWDRRRGAAVCDERAGLFGLGVVEARTILLHRVDPGLARHLLVRHALVEGDSDLDLGFVAHNRKAISAVRSLQARLRRDDLLVEETRLIALYAAVIPDHVVSEADLASWWRAARDPGLLCFCAAQLIDAEIPDGIESDYPDLWRAAGSDLRIDYRFEPGEPDDGMTVEVPLESLEKLDAAQFDWLVPGYRQALVEALLRTLPKALRRAVGPAAGAAGRLADQLDPHGDASLAVQLAAAVSRVAGTEASPELLDAAALPSWLRPHFRVTQEGLPLAEDDDLAVLKDWFSRQATELLVRESAVLERHGLSAFPDEDLPPHVIRRQIGQTVRFYPALADDGDSVSIRLFTSADEQAEAMWAGTRRLLLLQRPALGTVLRELLSDRVKAAIVASPYRDPAAWLEDCLVAAADVVIADHDGPLNERESHLRLLASFRKELPETLRWVADSSAAVLLRARQLQGALESADNPAFAVPLADMREQLDRLVYDGFAAAVGAGRLDDIARYLQAACLRAAALTRRAGRDVDRTTVIRSLESEHEQLAREHGWTIEIEELAWQLQELRVIHFSQSLGISVPVSVKRIRAGLQRIRQTETGTQALSAKRA